MVVRGSRSRGVSPAVSDLSPSREELERDATAPSRSSSSGRELTLTKHPPTFPLAPSDLASRWPPRLPQLQRRQRSTLRLFLPIIFPIPSRGRQVGRGSCASSSSIWLDPPKLITDERIHPFSWSSQAPILLRPSSWASSLFSRSSTTCTCLRRGSRRSERAKRRSVTFQPDLPRPGLICQRR